MFQLLAAVSVPLAVMRIRQSCMQLEVGDAVRKSLGNFLYMRMESKLLPAFPIRDFAAATACKTLVLKLAFFNFLLRPRYHWLCCVLDSLKTNQVAKRSSSAPQKKNSPSCETILARAAEKEITRQSQLMYKWKRIFTRISYISRIQHLLALVSSGLDK